MMDDRKFDNSNLHEEQVDEKNIGQRREEYLLALGIVQFQTAIG